MDIQPDPCFFRITVKVFTVKTNHAKVLIGRRKAFSILRVSYHLDKCPGPSWHEQAVQRHIKIGQPYAEQRICVGDSDSPKLDERYYGIMPHQSIMNGSRHSKHDIKIERHVSNKRARLGIYGFWDETPWRSFPIDFWLDLEVANSVFCHERHPIEHLDLIKLQMDRFMSYYATGTGKLIFLSKEERKDLQRNWIRNVLRAMQVVEKISVDERENLEQATLDSWTESVAEQWQVPRQVPRGWSFWQEKTSTDEETRSQSLSSTSSSDEEDSSLIETGQLSESEEPDGQEEGSETISMISSGHDKVAGNLDGQSNMIKKVIGFLFGVLDTNGQA